MEIITSSSCFEQAFEYIESKHNRNLRFVELPEFLENFETVLDGFRPGEVTLVNGAKSDDFFISLLHGLSLENNVYSYVISDRYSETYIGLNLLKYEMTKLPKHPLGLNQIYNGWFLDEEIEDVLKNYETQIKEREEQGFERFFPFSVSTFKEKNIEEICENIRTEIQRFDSESEKTGNEKRVIILRGVSKEDIKPLKELAEIFYVPIIIFTEQQEKSSYADCEICIKKGEQEFSTIPSKIRRYILQAKNNMTLLEGEGIINYDTRLCAFVSPEDEADSATGSITQTEINEILNKQENK